jgi:hypothetical protein
MVPRGEHAPSLNISAYLCTLMAAEPLGQLQTTGRPSAHLHPEPLDSGLPETS